MDRHNLIGAATEGLCEWLSDALLKLDHAWWSSLVLSSLSCPQRERVRRKRRNKMTCFIKFNLLTLGAARAYIARTSPLSASALGRKVAHFCAAFAFSGMPCATGGLCR